jgi:pyrroloquinoline quinone (PQQ) biosynthesis protein C
MAIEVTDAVRRYSPDEAAAEVERLRGIADRGFQRQIYQHPFMTELMAGKLSIGRIKAFMCNWYRFALEINTVKSDAYNHFLPWLERHIDCYDLLTEQIADELMHPGPGGHIKLLYLAGAAIGLTCEEMVETPLIPEARGLTDSRVRLWRDGPMAEAWASSLGETQVGIWMGMWHKALTNHYKLDPDEVQYFSKHYEADTKEHEEGIMAHGLGNGYILQKLLEDGYRPARPGWTLDYSIKLAVDLYELFLDGLYKRFD